MTPCRTEILPHVELKMYTFLGLWNSATQVRALSPAAAADDRAAGLLGAPAAGCCCWAAVKELKKMEKFKFPEGGYVVHNRVSF